MIAVLIVGHGSRLRGFQTAMKKVAAALRRRRLYDRVECAYLEAASPSIDEAIDACLRQGAKEIRVLPYFLLTGNHTQHDIPAIVKKAAKKHRRHARVLLCPYLGFDEKIVSLVARRVRQARPAR